MNYPKNVLLIDDDEEDFDILFTALHECCPTVELQYEKDGKTAIKRLYDEKIPAPDMVFLDWCMPMVSGRDILTSIRRLRHYAGVPVIIFTGSLKHSYRQDAEALGASFFLNKPSSITELSQKLQSLFSLEWKQIPTSPKLL
jgi:CheY-like chemotaxis protein